MSPRKTKAIGLRVEESLKETLIMIAEKEHRSVSRQVAYFVQQEIYKYLEEHPDIASKAKSSQSKSSGS